VHPPSPACPAQPACHLYVADGFNNRVVRVRETGGGQVTLGFTGLSTPTGLAFPPAPDSPGYGQD
jgi:hypothetical protein